MTTFNVQIFGCSCTQLSLLFYLPITIAVSLFWSDTRRTWEESDAYCKSIGRRLLTIRSEEEYNAVLNYLQSNGFKEEVWMGLRLSQAGTSYQWVGYNDPGYMLWKKSPSYSSAKACVNLRVMDAFHGFENERCDMLNSCVCEMRDLTELPAGRPKVLQRALQRGAYIVKTCEENLPLWSSFDVTSCPFLLDCAVQCLSSENCTDFTFGNEKCRLFQLDTSGAYRLSDSDDCAAYRLFMYM